MKLHIGIPVPQIYGNYTSVTWALQLTTMKKPKNTTFSVSQERPLAAARNVIVRNFFGYDSDYLLFIDTDTIPPVDGISKLCKHIDSFDIVSGLYLDTKTEQPVAYDRVAVGDDGYPTWGRVTEWNDSIIPVEAVGMGFCLIPRRVFKKIGQPYFHWLFDESEGYTRRSEPGYLNIGEDLYFCKKVREAGFTIGLDCSCKCAHVSSATPIFSQQKPSSH